MAAKQTGFSAVLQFREQVLYFVGKLRLSHLRSPILLMECSCVSYPASAGLCALVCLSSVSEPFAYSFFRLCLPLYDSFSLLFTVLPLSLPLFSKDNLFLVLSLCPPQ